jgi:hypothetical protein
MLHILHIFIHIILHIMHIILHIILHILHFDRKSHGSPSSDLWLLPLLFGSPSQGTAVDVPPPITVTAVLCFITDSPGKIRLLSSHVERYRPCLKGVVPVCWTLK